MRWTPGGVSEDIEDRRDEGGGGGFGGFGGRGLGVGGILILGVLSLVFRRDLITPFLGGDGTAVSAPNPAKTAAEKPEVQFISFVLDDVQNTWTKLLPESGARYRHAKLVLFRDATDSGCGDARSATGPFYCPEDEKVYIDLGFFDELKARFNAPGKFAQAYVLAHEIGHHVQKILGIEQNVRQQMRADPGEQNVLSVRLELQADCLAGVWAYSTQDRGILEKGDVERGLAAAAAVGDDRIARAAGARVAPERFTHGSSQQRVSWFRRGLERGTVVGCDTFVRR